MKAKRDVCSHDVRDSTRMTYPRAISMPHTCRQARQKMLFLEDRSWLLPLCISLAGLLVPTAAFPADSATRAGPRIGNFRWTGMQSTAVQSSRRPARATYCIALSSHISNRKRVSSPYVSDTDRTITAARNFLGLSELRHQAWITRMTSGSSARQAIRPFRENGMKHTS